MQDRFKVRAWDTEEGRYASDEDIRFDTGGSCDNVYDLVVVDDQFYIYEQCTGLRDKNGKLIYEGDILLIGEKRKEVEVIFQDEMFGFLYNNTCVSFQNQSPERIGSIYERGGLENE